MTIIGLVIGIGVLIFVLTLFGSTKKEAEVFIEGDKLVIKGQYGATYDLAGITGIELADAIPPVGRKVNGAGLGAIKKGDFVVEGLGTCRLQLHAAEGPFIHLTVGGQHVFLNFYDPARTAAKYEELRAVIQPAD